MTAPTRPSFLRHMLVPSLLLATLVTACASDQAAESSTYPGSIKQESAVDLANAPHCDLDTPCADGLTCIYIAALELDSAICVDGASICDALDCGDDSCALLESYPAQLVCASNSNPGDDGDCTVSSDGSTSCPPTDGIPGDTTPGDDCTVSSDGSTSCPPNEGGPGSSPGGEPGSSGSGNSAG